MSDDSKIIPRDHGASKPVEILSPGSRGIPAIELSPREPHLYDYLLVLRKQQWLILSFLLTVVTVVSVATFRMKPVYVATAKIEIDKESTNILPFQGTSAYDYEMDVDNYIETQSRILTSETLALETIRNMKLTDNPEFSGGGGSDAIAAGTLKNKKLPTGDRGISRRSECPPHPHHQFDGSEFRVHRSATCRADSQCPLGQLYRAKLQRPI